MTGVIANGLSGRPFNFVSSSDTRNVPPHDTWPGLPANSPYRQEWDSFARQLGVAPRERQNFALIKDAMRRYHEMVMQAASRGVSPRPTARADAAAQARAALFAPSQVQSMVQLTGGSGALAALAKSGVDSLAQSSVLAALPWGASLQQAASNPQTVLSFYSGIAQGVFEGGKDLVVGLASFAGSAVQYSADVTVGPAFDALRQAIPSGVQAWISNNANALIPSGERGAASTQKMGDALSKVGSYIANRTPEQVGNDIAGFVQQHWDSLKGSHAAAVAKGPEAEARWWGQLTGRAIFEIAAVAVPVTKVAQLAKLGKVAEGLQVVEVTAAAGLSAQALSRASRVVAAEEIVGIRSASGLLFNGLTGSGPLGPKVANTFRSGSYIEAVTGETTTLYRAYGGGSREIGPYWTRAKPAGPVQSIIDSALEPKWGNTATKVVQIEVPKGTTIYEGIAAAQSGLVGGGNQVFIREVDKAWIVK